jgi:hypothetical protein
MKTKETFKFRVEIVESERGWGQKQDSIKEFDTEGAASSFIKKYNSKNNLPTVPDWYMFARALNYVPV